MADSNEIVPRTLDLTSRSIDLAKVLIEASNSTGSLLEIGIQIGQWLQHEGLNRHELQEFFQHARDVAIPNANGLEFHQRVRETQVVKPLLPLFLQPSGSLGRLLIVDPALCWMVSTIGCLFRFHSEYGVRDAVMAIIAEKRRDIYPQSTGRMTSASRIQLQSVVEKIVSSVWYNIVNSGTNPMALPSCLDRLCAKGHNLDGVNLGRVIAALGERRDSVMIRSDRLLVNLALWLMLHFHGRLFVTVAGTIIFDEKLGEETTEIEWRVKEACTDYCGFIVSQQDVEILGIVGATFDVFLTVSALNFVPVPQTRQQLYSAKLVGATSLPKSSIIWTRCTAQQIMKWILSLPVDGITSKPDTFKFSVNPNAKRQEKSASGWKVLDIVKRSPAILNKRWGNKPPSFLIYSQVIEDAADDGGRSNLPSREIEPKELEPLLLHFPILRDLVASVKTQCECGDCVIESWNGEIRKVFRAGCYAHQALLEVILLLSHGVADSLGVDDASSHRDQDSLIGLTAVLLHRLVNMEMAWSSWFYVASSVLLGCSFDSDDVYYGSAVCAVQCGNLSTIAGWLDLNQELKAEGSFSLRSGEGTLGTMNETDDGLKFRGLMRDYAVVYTEDTEQISSHYETMQKASEPQDPSLEVLPDDSKVESDLFLVNATRQHYRLLTRIRTGHYSRLVDPAEAMIGAARCLPSYVCSQDHLCKKPFDPEDCIITYSFDDMLGCWRCYSGADEVLDEGSAKGRRSSYHVSRLLDSYLKLNVAYALSEGNLMITNREGTCAGCAIAHCESYDKGDEVHDKKAGGSHKERFIVNAAIGKKKPRLIASGRCREEAVHTDPESP